MKKIWILLLLLIGLAFVAYNVVSKTDTKTTLTKNDRDFTIKDISTVHKITIKTRTRPEMHLTRSGRDWLVNYKEVVNPNSMMRLLEVVKNMRLQYIPHPNALENIKDDMELIGLHVEIFDKEDKKLKGYYIGSGTADELGTHVQMEGSDQPYVMEMASYRGSLRGRFILTPEQWREKKFIREDVSKIAKITVEYPKSKEDSFVLDVEKNEVAPYNRHSLQTASTPKPGTVKAYVNLFEEIGAESIVNHHSQKDSIIALVPFAKITIEDNLKEKRSYRLFPMKDITNRRVNTGSIQDTKTQQIERYLVDCSNGDFILAQHILVRKILLSLDFFKAS